jgi:hypothetical protein
MILRALVLVSISALAIGCDSSPAPSDAAAAAAKADKEKEDAEAAKRTEEFRKKREAEEQKKKEAEEAKAAAFDAVCVVPEGAKKPKKLAQACQAVVDAHDGFMQRHYAGDTETLEKWNAAKGTQVPFTLATCNKTGSLEAAMCQKHALDTAPAELKEDAPELLRRCIDKYAGGRAAKGPALPVKRPG